MDEIGRFNYCSQAVASGMTATQFRQAEKEAYDVTKDFLEALGESVRERMVSTGSPNQVVPTISVYLDMVPAKIVEDRGDVDYQALMVEIAEKAVINGDITIQVIMEKKLLTEKSFNELLERLKVQQGSE